MKTIENIDDLIAKFLSGNANPEEIEQLEVWKKENEANANHYHLNEILLKKINSEMYNQPVNTNSAWHKLNHQISNSETKVIPLYQKPIFLKSVASVILIIGIGILTRWIFDSGTTQTQQFATLNNTELDTLPDGSIIFMNKNTQLNYELKNNMRKVILNGEAFFEVRHNEKQPFEIIINNVVIKDIGTAFNVKAINGSGKIEVAVESGEVEFFTNSQVGIHLTKNQKAIYDITEKKFTKSDLQSSENIASYKSKKFNFNETTLQLALDQINSIYNTDIKLFDSTFASKKISVKFNNESIDVILNVISETFNMEIIKKDNSIILKEKVEMFK